MRISDWSSDVCSSDLLPAHEAPEDAGAAGYQGEAPEEDGDHDDEDHDDGDHDDGDHGGDGDDRENGEAETLAAAGSDENAGNGAAAENGNGAGAPAPEPVQLATEESVDTVGGVAVAEADRNSTRLDSSHSCASRMPSA